MIFSKLKYYFIFLLLVILLNPYSAYSSSPVAYGLCYYRSYEKKWFAFFLAVRDDNIFYDAEEIIRSKGSDLFAADYLKAAYCAYNADNTISIVKNVTQNNSTNDFELEFLEKPRIQDENFVLLAPCYGGTKQDNCSIDISDKYNIQKELDNAYKLFAQSASTYYKKCFSKKADINTFIYNSQGYYFDNDNKCQYYANIQINNTMPDQCSLGDEFWCNMLLQYDIENKITSLYYDLTCRKFIYILHVYDFDDDGKNDLIMATDYIQGAASYKIIKGTDINGPVLFESKILEAE